MSLVELMKLPPQGNDRTFLEDENLPPLPLPSLQHSLERYLDSVRPFVPSAQYLRTKDIVENFRNGIGKELHEILQHKAAKSRNWVEKWWEDLAYLENRQPLLPFCSMTGYAPLEDVWMFAPGRMIKYASLYMYYTVEMWQLLRAELLTPTRSVDLKTTFSMQQFRRLFNCARIPLIGRDRLDVHFKTESEGPCPSHIIVLCNGHMYMFEVIPGNSSSPLTPPEWERMLQFIVDEASCRQGQGICRFSCDDRDTWAMNRGKLVQLSGENARNLSLIDSALCVLTLEPSIFPSSASEITMESISGIYENQWADKSMGITFFGNGRSGGLADHTAFDGMISVTSMFYTYQSLVETNGQWKGTTTIRALPYPVELNFILNSSMNAELVRADEVQSINKKKVIMIRERFTGFGKTFTSKHRIHPDTFVQMALQLAYVRIHGKPAPCYETATTRAFYNGRTETVRSCTMEMLEWVRAMTNVQVSVTEKVRLMRTAATKHDNLMKEAREGTGCDRHLFGLYCVAAENGIPLPDIFSDPSYMQSGGGGNFALSTSLVGYTPIGGGVAPMCLDGYGCFYNICPDSFSFTISVMRDSSETSATKFFDSLSNTFHDMASVLQVNFSQQQATPKSNL